MDVRRKGEPFRSRAIASTERDGNRSADVAFRPAVPPRPSPPDPRRRRARPFADACRDALGRRTFPASVRKAEAPRLPRQSAYARADATPRRACRSGRVDRLRGGVPGRRRSGGAGPGRRRGEGGEVERPNALRGASGRSALPADRNRSRSIDPSENLHEAADRRRVLFAGGRFAKALPIDQDAPDTGVASRPEIVFAIIPDVPGLLR